MPQNYNKNCVYFINFKKERGIVKKLKLIRKLAKFIGFALLSGIYIYAMPDIYYPDIYITLVENIPGFLDIFGESAKGFFIDWFKDSLMLTLTVISFCLCFMYLPVLLVKRQGYKKSDCSIVFLIFIHDFFYGMIYSIWVPVCFAIFSIVYKYEVSAPAILSFLPIFVLMFFAFSGKKLAEHITRNVNVSDNDFFEFEYFNVVDSNGKILRNGYWLLFVGIMFFCYSVYNIIIGEMSDTFKKYKFVLDFLLENVA